MYLIGGDSKGTLQVLDAKNGNLLTQGNLKILKRNATSTPRCRYDKTRDEIDICQETAVHTLCPRTLEITAAMPLGRCIGEVCGVIQRKESIALKHDDVTIQYGCL